MKIKSEHYAQLEETIDSFFKRVPNVMQSYIDRGNTEMRMRWDVFFHCTSSEFRKTLYSYLNDDNIDSALKKIMKERE